MRALAWLVLAAVALYGAVCLLAFTFQRRLLYFPERYGEVKALAEARRRGLAPWRDAQGALVGWRAAARGTLRARLLVLHGNAGSALDRLHYAAALAPRGVEVFLLEYPGYGSRPGAPSLPALSVAAAAGVRALAALGPEPVLLLGESLGTGVAARAIALEPSLVRGLALVTPYARMAEVGRLHYPFLPGAILRDRWSPLDDLAAWEGPTAVVVAGRDEVVTPAQGRRLYDSLRGPKRLWEQPQAGHNGLDLDPGQPLWPEMLGLLLRPGRRGGG
jgi:uncharacterized protein